MKRILGVLGGMGPAATANFMKLLTLEFHARGIFDECDFPRTVVLNIPLRDWVVEGAKDKGSVARQVRDGVLWLRETAQADFIAIPCNTVQEFVTDMRKLGVIDIIDETLQLCAPGSSIGVLCSRQTRESKLYETGRCDVVYYPNQNTIDDIISGVLHGKTTGIGPLINIAFKSCSTAILGCTELSLCSVSFVDKTIIDSSIALAKATVREMLR